MKQIEEIRERHEKEIANLQASCSHPDISSWMPFMWAPGHFGSDVKVCNDCGKIIERRGIGEEEYHACKGKGWVEVAEDKPNYNPDYYKDSGYKFIDKYVCGGER